MCRDASRDRSRHPRRMRNPHFYVSGMIPMLKCAADARCIAFNLGNGFCVLPSRLPKCHEPDDNDEFISTQLTQPDFKTPKANNQTLLITVTCSGFLVIQQLSPPICDPRFQQGHAIVSILKTLLKINEVYWTSWWRNSPLWPWLST